VEETVKLFEGLNLASPALDGSSADSNAKLADEVGRLSSIFTEIARERIRQGEQWGEQDHPMLGDSKKKGWFPSRDNLESTLNSCRKQIEEDPNWFSILLEEFLETFLETEPEKQREEMIQVAAVAVQIIERLDRRREAVE
jgi:hypothetical protein